MAAREQVTLVIRARDATRRAFGSITRSIAGLSAGVVALGVSLGAALANASFRRAKREVESLRDAVNETGESSSNLKNLLQAGAATGLSAQEIVGILRRIEEAKESALSAKDFSFFDEFADLGVTAKELQSLQPSEILRDILLGRDANALKDIRADLEDIFGRATGDVISLGGINEDLEARLAQIQAANRETEQERQKNLAALEEYDAAVARLNAEVTTLGTRFFGPATDFNNSLADLLTQANQVLDRLEGLTPVGLAEDIGEAALEGYKKFAAATPAGQAFNAVGGPELFDKVVAGIEQIVANNKQSQQQFIADFRAVQEAERSANVNTIGN